ncbi:hypothetical protein K435DRAFT_876512 [Dendrothele bispora CBS 962.96]|uniref:Uncharacterized protein n=1 Tax=Dendrothele bispora (strain CBS 962.96) TaxID=1314807 RepID=A0A4S8KRW8_DENBC|nr:hypothetical protein K435DRAFT_876512 [Dendrothele bispora CBS 962.96]
MRSIAYILFFAAVLIFPSSAAPASAVKTPRVSTSRSSPTSSSSAHRAPSTQVPAPKDSTVVECLVNSTLSHRELVARGCASSKNPAIDRGQISGPVGDRPELPTRPAILDQVPSIEHFIDTSVCKKGDSKKYMFWTNDAMEGQNRYYRTWARANHRTEMRDCWGAETFATVDEYMQTTDSDKRAYSNEFFTRCSIAFARIASGDLVVISRPVQDHVLHISDLFSWRQNDPYWKREYAELQERSSQPNGDSLKSLIRIDIDDEAQAIDQRRIWQIADGPLPPMLEGIA